MDCFGTYFTHAQSCDNVRVPSATEWTASVHTLRMPKACDNVRVPSATQWTASVHSLHMPKAVITFMFKVLQEGLLRYIHMPKAVITFQFKVLRTGLLRCILLHMPKAVIKFVFEVYGMDCWRTYLTHAHICDNVRVQSTTEWIVFSPFSRFRRFRDFAFSFFPFRCLAFSRFSCSAGGIPAAGTQIPVCTAK